MVFIMYKQCTVFMALLFFFTAVGSVDYRLVFKKSKTWKHFVDKFNDELAQMKKNGELDRILAKYK